MTDHLTIDQVSSTYNGKARSCCCGCSGTHSYPTDPDRRAAAESLRGYEIKDEECNEKKMAFVIRKLNANWDEVENLGSCLSYETETRLYIAYLVDANRPTPDPKPETPKEDTVKKTTPTEHTYYKPLERGKGFCFDIGTCDRCEGGVQEVNGLTVDLTTRQALARGYEIWDYALPLELDVNDDGDALCSDCTMEMAAEIQANERPASDLAGTKAETQAEPFKGLDRLKRQLDSTEEVAEKDLDKFKANLNNEDYLPTYAFEWSLGAFIAAGKIEVTRQVRALILAQDSGDDEDIFEAAKRMVTERVLAGAEYPTQSSSPAANLTGTYRTAAWADLLSSMQWM